MPANSRNGASYFLSYGTAGICWNKNFFKFGPIGTRTSHSGRGIRQPGQHSAQRPAPGGMVSPPDVHAPASQDLRLPPNPDHRPPPRPSLLTLQSSWSGAQGYRIWLEGSGVCEGNRVQLSGTGGREVDEEIKREKQDRIFPTSSHRFPVFPILPANSRYFLSTALRWNKIFQIRPHSVPFLLFLAFGRAMPRWMSADTSRGAVRPRQASSTIYRTHDHMLSKSKGLGKRQMFSGFPNAIALVRCLRAGNPELHPVNLRLPCGGAFSLDQYSSLPSYQSCPS